MAEFIGVTWELTLLVNNTVTTPFNLYLKESPLEWGKWTVNPPSEIKGPKPGLTVVVKFTATGREWTATGTQGKVVYEADDNERDPTTFEFTFDIPYVGDNGGNGFIIKGAANGNYNLDSHGGVPKNGNHPTAKATITQIKPTI